MGRYFSSLVMLLGVVFWLIFSYAPGAADALPKLTASGSLSKGWLQALAVLSLLLFVLIQLIILRATMRMQTTVVENAGHDIRLNFVWELVWAGLPLVMTVGLALLSYRTWVSLSSP